jgi:hypothetical protein
MENMSSILEQQIVLLGFKCIGCIDVGVIPVLFCMITSMLQILLQMCFPSSRGTQKAFEASVIIQTKKKLWLSCVTNKPSVTPLN